MQETKNYKLKKPDLDDFYDIQDFNANTDIIDKALSNIQSNLNKIEQNIYTSQEVDEKFTKKSELEETADEINLKLDSFKKNIGKLEVSQTPFNSIVQSNNCTIVAGAKYKSILASKGECLKLVTDKTEKQLLTGVFKGLNYGRYGISLRMSIDKKDDRNVALIYIKARNKNKGTIKTLLTKTIKGEIFESPLIFYQFYFNVDFNGDESGECELLIEINTHPESSETNVMFDYAYASLMMPAVYI